MAFEFLKEMYRNSVMGMEAAREKEEARQRAIARQEEEERRIKRFRQYHLDKIHEECLDKFGEGFTGKIYLDSCKDLYPPDGLEKPIVRTSVVNSKRYPAVHINPSQKRYEAAAEILKEMPEGIQFHSLTLKEDGSPKRESKYNVGVFDYTHEETYTQEMRYSMQYAVSEDYSSRFFSRFCTEYVIHDPMLSESLVQQASEFAERIGRTRQNVITELLAFIRKTDPIMSWRRNHYNITSTGVVGSKLEHIGDDHRKEIEESFKKYGLSELDFVQRYGLALCLAKVAKPEGNKTFRYRLSCTPNVVCVSIVHLPVKEAPKPEPILEQW